MRVGVVGAGIGGLSAAAGLLKLGHSVTLFEQAQELREVGAGVQISPNGNRALDWLGCFEAVAQTSWEPTVKQFRHWQTGRAWPMFDLNDAWTERYEYPYFTVYRPDLLDALANRVRQLSPVSLCLNQQCIGVEQSPHEAVLSFADGTRKSFDIVLGADGVHSVIRQQLFGDDQPTFSGMEAWRCVVPTSELPEPLQRGNGTIWIGPHGHAVTYPLRGNALVNFVGVMGRSTWQTESWTAEAAREDGLATFADWHPELHRLLEAAPSLSRWALMVREPMARWSLGRVTLMGDACHPTLPFLAQGAVHAIEDGVVFARCLTHFEGDPLQALRSYEAARLDRTGRMVRQAKANTHRFQNDALVSEASAELYVQRELNARTLSEKYDWLYRYDASSCPLPVSSSDSASGASVVHHV